MRRESPGREPSSGGRKNGKEGQPQGRNVNRYGGAERGNQEKWGRHRHDSEIHYHSKQVTEECPRGGEKRSRYTDEEKKKAGRRCLDRGESLGGRKKVKKACF